MSDWIAQGLRAGEQLLQVSAGLAGLPGTMTERLEAFAVAEDAAGPFIEAAPGRLDAIRSGIATRLAGSGTPVDDLLGDRESEAAREVRNLYRIALKIARQPEAREVVVNLSANKAFRALTSRFPDIATDLTAHLQEFGWIRTVSTGLDIASPKESLQRVQAALLRWDAGTIALAAEPPAAKLPEAPEGVHRLLVDYRRISEDLAFSPGLPVKARWTARLLFGEVASAVDRPLHEILNTPARELIDAVANGSGLSPKIAPPALSGAAVSLGRAVGRVRVVLDADEGARIRIGDIIVTNLSTPTYEGQPSIFPYRTVPSVPIEKAAAIVTDEGGLLSHAAIICRENSVPSLLGAEGASETLKDGMIVEVDATRAEGHIWILAG
ncbi:MAG: PEP-utilizing enzyme [Actinomycetota bacterium]